MTTAQEVLRVAASQVGYREGAGNRTKYGKWYNMDGVPWCAIFTSWVGAQAHGSTALLGRFSYTSAQADHFRGLRRFYRSGPRAGDLVFFDFPDSLNRIQHVGIVEKVLSGGRIQTIEGNTSPNSGGSQSNGGGVYRRIRTTSAVVGYGRPKYSSSVVRAVKQVFSFTLRRVLSEGDRGADVRELQGRLQRLGHYKGAVDGIFGAQTEAAVRTFQKARGLTIDGVVGLITARTLGWKFA